MKTFGKKNGRAGSGPKPRISFLPGRARAEILISLSARPGLGPKHLFLFRNCSIAAKICLFISSRVRPEKCGPLKTSNSYIRGLLYSPYMLLELREFERNE